MGFYMGFSQLLKTDSAGWSASQINSRAPDSSPRETRASSPREPVGTTRVRPSGNTRVEPRERVGMARGRPSLNSRTAPRDSAKGVFVKYSHSGVPSGFPHAPGFPTHPRDFHALRGTLWIPSRTRVSHAPPGFPRTLGIPLRPRVFRAPSGFTRT